jgi:hypothetical protein
MVLLFPTTELVSLTSGAHILTSGYA